MSKKKKCIVCGKATYNKMFCSNACRSANSPPTMKICAFCQKEYKADRKDQKYCCRDCYNSHKKILGNVMVKCVTCGKEFQVIKAKKNVAKFCSNKCKFEKNKKPVPRKLSDAEVLANLSKLCRMEKPSFKRSCANCFYCQMVLEPYSDRGCWACANAGSKYYKSLLNIDENGLANRNVSWCGCEHWRMERSRNKVRRRTLLEDYELYDAELEKVEDLEKKQAEAERVPMWVSASAMR